MYLDTSVLTKLFIAEPDSEVCAIRTAGATLVSSELSYGEIFSAFLKNERTGSLAKKDREASWTDFERRITEESLLLATLDRTIIRQARDVMLEVHPKVALRTLDAIHLATCLSIVAGPLFTMDKRMREAATLLGIPLVE